MKFYVYVLKSLKDGSLSKGHCVDLERRLSQHNAGETKSIRNKIPFEVIYKEEFNSREEAIIREKYFKSAAGRRFLKKILPLKFNARPNDVQSGGDSCRDYSEAEKAETFISAFLFFSRPSRFTVVGEA